MASSSIPESLRRQTHEHTGGTWECDDAVVTLTLGPKIQDPNLDTAEAQWAADLYEQLKGATPGRQWSAVVDLGKLPRRWQPPLAMTMIFAKMMKDPMTKRVAMIHVSHFQREVVRLYLLTKGSVGKIRFFERFDEAAAWVREEEGPSPSPRS
ncbi:MAG: hypothetical protein HY566_03350 [Candidatus Kerfeldbacteria bacterium]|nr:hypothetical protein [Candidatus Kerfeldbacteria bacterium]